MPRYGVGDTVTDTLTPLYHQHTQSIEEHTRYPRLLAKVEYIKLLTTTTTITSTSTDFHHTIFLTYEGCVPRDAPKVPECQSPDNIHRDGHSKENLPCIGRCFGRCQGQCGGGLCIGQCILSAPLGEMPPLRRARENDATLDDDVVQKGHNVRKMDTAQGDDNVTNTVTTQGTGNMQETPNTAQGTTNAQRFATAKDNTTESSQTTHTTTTTTTTRPVNNNTAGEDTVITLRTEERKGETEKQDRAGGIINCQLCLGFCDGFCTGKCDGFCFNP
ncbi:hypothetical protein Pmani_014544 [Petrolisthes manimaculis]|uniref:Uncharacterized protein n=1 Tax=Petrolisthes manimaculis TaxID=1843537 RepID=A0AAE1PVX8_9EUCA|nr:hypothetical protein Pmani_014544 [Petrolisthes manimaculis]